MNRTFASSPRAKDARTLVETLQATFREGLGAVGRQVEQDATLSPIEWVRDAGRHGGGVRVCTAKTPLFRSASVNVSQVHYDDDQQKRLRSATALSTIIHPRHPRAPSMHMHISWTEMRDGSGYWRLMADLNPTIAIDDDTAAFDAALKEAAPSEYDAAKAQGERYFYIPALKRHRGVAHFYLENYRTDDEGADLAFAQQFGAKVISAYCSILARALERAPAPTADDDAKQLEYHSVYLFQVLTLDRGTTSGLLVHAQNDVGTLGSIPPYVDWKFLAATRASVPALQVPLVDGLVKVLRAHAEDPESGRVEVTDAMRAELAQVVREHYQAYPAALSLQASGDVVPPTVANHLST